MRQWLCQLKERRSAETTGIGVSSGASKGCLPGSAGAVGLSRAGCDKLVCTGGCAGFRQLTPQAGVRQLEPELLARRSAALALTVLASLVSGPGLAKPAA